MPRPPPSPKIEAARIAKLVEERRKLKTENDFREGQLVEREEVEGQAAAAGTALRQWLQGLPTQLAAQCEQKTAAEIVGILDARIYDALQTIVTALEKMGGGK